MPKPNTQDALNPMLRISVTKSIVKVGERNFDTNSGSFESKTALLCNGGKNGITITISNSAKIWSDEQNAKKLEQYDKGLCGGVPFFFNTDTYLEFIEKARKSEINAPIVPGIVLITNFEQFVNFSKKIVDNH